MTIKEIYNKLLPEIALNTQLINTDTTTNGNIIDIADFELGILFLLKTGVVTAGDVTPLLEESDDSTFTTSNEVADLDIVPINVSGTWYETGQEALLKIDASNTVKAFGYKGNKRYLRLSVVTANSADLTVGANVIKKAEYMSVYGK
jgi:hypothetical protein